MTKVILFGYRDWALKIIESLSTISNVEIVDTIKSQEEYLLKANSLPKEVDILLFIGWSWIIPPEVTSKYLCLGIHPSDLPNYRGGSPIQNQIIAGLIKSKVSLITLSSEKLDAGDVWLKYDLDFGGDNMNEIFENLVKSTIELLKVFFNSYPSIIPIQQDLTKGSYCKRRKLEESEITRKDFMEADLIYLYNKIRCLTDPYPNTYLQDEKGNRLYFTGVKYVSNES